MSIVVTYNGQEFVIPQYGDAGWADNVTNYFSALSTGSLTKSGGTFALLADTNFGATYGLVSEYYKSNSSNIATAGELRLSNTDTIQFRNGANNGNLSLSISGDELYFNGSSITPDLNNYLSTAGGTFALLADTNFGATYGLVSPYFKSTSSNISTTGAVRLANTDTVKWRNGANSADLSLYVSGNNLYFDGTQLNGGGGGTADQLISSTTPVATTGVVRLGNVDEINWRDGADSANLSLYVSSDDLYFNGVKLNGNAGDVGSITYNQVSGAISSASGMTAITDFTLPMGGVGEPVTIKFDAFVRYQSDGIGLILGYQAPAGARVNAQIYIQKTETLNVSASFPLGGTSNSSGSLDGATSNTSGVYVATISGTCISGETSGNFEIQFAASDDGSGISIQPFSSCIYTVLQV